MIIKLQLIYYFFLLLHIYVEQILKEWVKAFTEKENTWSCKWELMVRRIS